MKCDSAIFHILPFIDKLPDVFLMVNESPRFKSIYHVYIICVEFFLPLNGLNPVNCICTSEANMVIDVNKFAEK